MSKTISEYKRLVTEQETTIALLRSENMRLASQLRAKRTRNLLLKQKPKLKEA